MYICNKRNKLKLKVLEGHSIPHGHMSVLKSNYFIGQDEFLVVYLHTEHITSLSFHFCVPSQLNL